MNPLRLLFYQLKQFLKHPLFWLLLPLILILPLFFGGEDGIQNNFSEYRPCEISGIV